MDAHVLLGGRESRFGGEWRVLPAPARCASTCHDIDSLAGRRPAQICRNDLFSHRVGLLLQTGWRQRLGRIVVDS
jgi:hypothetical protein